MKKHFSLAPSERKLLLASGDILLLFVALVVPFWLWAGKAGDPFDLAFIWARGAWLFLPVIWFFFAAIGGVYRQDVMTSFRESSKALLKCSVAIITIYVFIYFLFPPSSLARGVVIYHTWSSFLLLAGWRCLFFSLTETPFFKRRCLILGHEDEVETMTTFLARYPFLTVVHLPYTDGGVLFFEQAGELLSLIKPHEVDEIIVGETAELGPEIRADLIRCRERGIGITPFSVLYESLTERIPLDFLGKRGWPLILLDAAHARGIYPLVKRFFDVVWGVLGLVGFGILFPFIALAIKLDSPGPILYRQVRRGREESPLPCGSCGPCLWMPKKKKGFGQITVIRG